MTILADEIESYLGRVVSITPGARRLLERAVPALRSTSAPQSDRPCETCNDDPAACATVPGLRHCEKATRCASDSAAQSYWLIERNSPAEYWVGGVGNGDGTMRREEWTSDPHKAQRFIAEWAAVEHARKLESLLVKGPLRACEHIFDCGASPHSETPRGDTAKLVERIHQFDAAIRRIADHVGAVCGGVDTGPLGGHTADEIIRCIDALRSNGGSAKGQESAAPSPLGGIVEIVTEYDRIVQGRLDPRDAEADFVMRGSDWREIRKALAQSAAQPQVPEAGITARRTALEEAARLCEGAFNPKDSPNHFNAAMVCAGGIRNLMVKDAATRPRYFAAAPSPDGKEER